MRVPVVLALLAGCGRIGFDATGSSADAPPGGPDAPVTPFVIEVDGDRSRIEDLQRLPDGSVVVAGHTDPGTTFGGVVLDNAGNNDVFVVSLTSTGTVRWVRTYGGPMTDFARGVSVAPDGTVYVVGELDPGADFGEGPVASTDHDAYLASLTAAGDLRWVRLLTGVASGTDSGTFVRALPDGDVIVGGARNNRGFTARYSPDNVSRWEREWTTTGLVRAWGADVDAAGNVYVAGDTEGALDLGNGPVAGFGNADGFLAALDGATGVPRWGLLWGGPADDEGKDVVVLGSTVIITGSYEDTIDLAVPAARGESDLIFAAWSTAGDAAWARAFGSPGCEHGQSLRADPDRAGARFGGSFAGTIDLGTGTLTADGADGVAGHLLPDGTIDGAVPFTGPGDDTVFAADGEYAAGTRGDTFINCGSSFIGRGFVERGGG